MMVSTEVRAVCADQRDTNISRNVSRGSQVVCASTGIDALKCYDALRRVCLLCWTIAQGSPGFQGCASQRPSPISRLFLDEKRIQHICWSLAALVDPLVSCSSMLGFNLSVAHLCLE